MNATLEKLKAWNCDTDGALQRMMGDEGLYESFILKYKDAFRITELIELINKNRVKEAFEIAHDLKGSLGNLGITPLYTVICRIVEPLRAGKCEGLWELTAELEGKYKEFLRLF